MSESQSGKQSEPLTQRYKSFWKLLVVVTTFAMGTFYFGYAIAYFSSIDFDTLVKVYDITWDKPTAKGLLTGCVPIGGGIGALASDILIKRFSRRQYIFVVNAIAFVAGLLVFIQNPVILLFVRIIQGVCVGFYSAIIPVIIKEISPNEISGTLGALNQLFIAFGVFFSFFLKYMLEKILNEESGESYWWVIFGLPLLTIVLQSLLLRFVFPYETPKYLLLNNREDEARWLIEQFYLEQFVEEVLEEKYLDMRKATQARNTDDNKESVLTYQKEDRQTQATNKLLPKKKLNKTTTFIAMHLALLQQFVGINAVVGYGGDIAASAIPSLKSIFPMLINLEQVLTSLIVSYLLASVGRKTILQIGTMVGAISNGIIGIGFFIHDSNADVGNVFILFGLVIFMANFGLSLGPVVWLYIAQIVQPNIIPFSTGVNWAGAALVMLLFPIITQILPNKNPGYLFLFFCAWCIASFLINAKYTIQTKGKTEKQIQQQYEQL